MVIVSGGVRIVFQDTNGDVVAAIIIRSIAVIVSKIFFQFLCEIAYGRARKEIMAIYVYGDVSEILDDRAL